MAAETLPPLRINSALLGAGTPSPSTPLATEPVAASKPVTPVSAPVLAPLAPKPTQAVRVEAAPPQAKAVLIPVAPPAAPVAHVTAPAAPIAEPPAAAPIVAPVQSAAAAEAVPKPQEPPLVAERPQLPPLYSAHVAAGELPATKLKPAVGILPYLKKPRELLPTFIAADQITGKNDVELVATGNVELRKRNTVLLSDRLTYWQNQDEMEAEGNVRLARDGDRVRGPKMRMKMEDNTGYFEQPEYSIRRSKIGVAATLSTDVEDRVATNLTTGQGAAKHMEFEGDGKYRLTDATYTTCSPAPGRDPEWFARTTDLRLNYNDEEGTARNATLYFKGIPFLYSPWMNFSLNNERKSGLLTPTVGSTSRGGMEYTQPVYWNIAANMDATVAPRIMSKRGTLWDGEYRYLQPSYSGNMHGQYLPNDKLAQRSRSSFSLTHNQYLGYGFSGALDLNRASDGTFFSDLGAGASVIAQTNLLRQATLKYAGGWWSANVLAQSFQTLQDPSLPPVIEPYRRLPQLTLTANRSKLPLGLTFAFNGEYVNFSNATPTLEQARRFTLYPQVSLPLTSDAFTLTPKLGLHSTSYSRDRQPIGTPDKLSRNLPIFSLDSGVAFERDLDWLGKPALQTLEPRLYYLYVPVRDQSQYPVFDSAQAGFDFAQIFGENRYAGGDRVGDANQATVALTSRLLDPLTGVEIVRATVGQRLYFDTQKVGLPVSATAPAEVLRSDRQTNYLAALSVRLQPQTYANADLQYNPRLNRMETLNVGGRYSPEAGKLINADYRYTRDLLGQFDISGQWPVWGGWHAVGRVNYSTKEHRMIETVGGLEYDGGCWVGRAVFQRLATQTQQSNTALFFQLEFSGFAKVGSNPLDILKRSVPGYGLINQQGIETPVTKP